MQEDSMKTRIQSIDVLRGIVMVVMALDHTREFVNYDKLLGHDPLDLSTTSTAEFLTRWVTHFCAPVFVFLSGASVFFMSQKKTRNEIALFLVTRGLWLMVLEQTVFQLAWAGDFVYSFMSFGVIAVLGLCMVLLSVLIYFPNKVLIAFGLLLVFGHNSLDGFKNVSDDLPGFIWSILHAPHNFNLGGHVFEVLYCVIPWLGLMILGYLFGSFYEKDFDPVYRSKILMRLGVGCIILFVLFRSGNFYGDFHFWQKQSTLSFTVLSFLDTSKYPPSLLFILMTMGPGLLFLALAEKWRGALLNPLITFGRVPLFYYVLHLFLIHGVAWFIFYLQGHSMSHVDVRNFTAASGGIGVQLPMVYLIWVGVVVALYFPCKWYNDYKRSHNHKWLSYL